MLMAAYFSNEYLRNRSQSYVTNSEAVTSVRKANQIRHYQHTDRYITVRERARIQSFPDTHRFAGKRTDMYNQIGNAIPVELGIAIASSVDKFLRKAS